MPGKPVRIGPFSDGLNNVSQSGEAKDSEVLELVNFEVGPDNLLWSRPPYLTVDQSVIDGTTVTNNWKILGIYRYSSTEWYLMVDRPKVGGGSDIQAYLSGNMANTPITLKSVPVGSKVTAFVQMGGDCFFCVSTLSPITSFKWNKDIAVVDVPAMKKGSCMIAYKSRLWISGVDTVGLTSRLYFSAIGTGGPTPDIWNQSDFLDVAPGEGGFVTALLALNSSIMVFKNDGTWRFSYSSSPGKGQVDKISGSIGAAGVNSVIEFENYVYIYDQGRVYELVNSSFTQLNRFVLFEKDLKSVDSVADGVDMSILSRRIVVRYFNNIYVYSVDSRAWSQWRSEQGTPGKLYELPADSSSTAASVYVAASRGTLIAATANSIPAFTEKYAAYLNSSSEATTAVVSAGTSLEITGTALSTVVLNNDAKQYDIKVAAGQLWKLTGTLTNANASITARLTCLLRDGSTANVDQALTANAVDKTFLIPASAIAAKLSVIYGVAGTYTMQGMQLVRQSVKSPATIIQIKDEYNPVNVATELIECVVRTKSYDFQSPSGMKRLFWWGADIKTNQPLTTRLIPMALRSSPTWGELRAYTWGQLRAGMWGNPLSFLSSSLDIMDGGNPAAAETENGRIFVKLIKSIRFKQVGFEVILNTTGTKETGPAKIHTLTAYVAAKDKVVDKFN